MSRRFRRYLIPASEVEYGGVLLSDTLSPTDQAALRNLAASLTTYRRAAPGGSLATLRAFLAVADQGPITPLDISRCMGAPQSAVSTALSMIAENSPLDRKRLKPSPSLISSAMHPVDARSKLFALTEKGAQLAAEMRATLETTGQEMLACES